MLKTGKVRTTQQSSFEPQRYQRVKIIFITFGALALLICILGILFLFLNFTLVRILEQTKIPLALLFAAGLLGIWDLRLWIPVSSVSTASTSSTLTPSFLQGDLQRSNTASTHPPYPLQPGRENAHPMSGYSPTDPNATSSMLNDSSSWPTPDFSTENMVTAIAASQPALPPQTTLKQSQIGATYTSPGALTFRSFAVPREGDNPQRNADKLAYNEERGRYALADGVGTSFLPGHWAEIVTKYFVERENDFKSSEDIIQWQKYCSKQWYIWVEQTWLPEARAASGQQDWSRDIARGAATTFVGCSFSPTELTNSDTTNVHVTVVGDTEFFLLSSTGNETTPWKCKEFYKLKLDEFGRMVENLATPEKRVERDYKWMNQHYFPVRKGDCIVLATDALAQWILQQMQDGQDPWLSLLSISNHEEFKQFVRNARNTSNLEVDDTTLMIIPLL